MVEQLVARGFQTALAEVNSQVLPLMDSEMVAPLHEELGRHGVTLAFGDGIRRILADSDGNATGVELQSGKVLDGSLVDLGIGVRPNTALRG